MDMYQKRKVRKEKIANKEVDENNGKMNINCLKLISIMKGCKSL